MIACRSGASRLSDDALSRRSVPKSILAVTSDTDFGEIDDPTFTRHLCQSALRIELSIHPVYRLSNLLRQVSAPGSLHYNAAMKQAYPCYPLEGPLLRSTPVAFSPDLMPGETKLC